MNIEMIPLDAIEVEDRIRVLNPAYAEEIAISFEDKGGHPVGQITPIEVRRLRKTGKYRLISGLHRLEAARDLRWPTIAASVLDCTDNEARLREIDENLARHDLTAMDRALFIHERQRRWDAEHPDSLTPQQVAARARWGQRAEMRAAPCGYASDIAAKLGVSKDTIERAVKLGNAILSMPADVRERLARTDFADRSKELQRLAELPPDEQRAVIEILLSETAGAPKKVQAAVHRMRGVETEHVPPAEANYQSFLKVWARSDKATRDRITSYVRRESR